MKEVPLVLGALGTIPLGLEKRLEELEIRERIETVQSSTFLKSAGILRSVLVSWEDLSLRLHWGSTSWRWYEKLSRSETIIILKTTGDLEVKNKNIQPRYRNGIWHWKMRHAHKGSGKRETRKGIEQQNQEGIRLFGEKENYKYLRILEAKMKEKIRKEQENFILCSRNLIKGKNTWASLYDNLYHS